MFFGRIGKLRHTLAFRLTLWYAGIFVFSAGVAFILFYLHITAVIRQKTDNDLLSQANELAGIYDLQGIDMLQRSALLQAQAAGEKKMFFRLFYPGGVAFSSSNMSYWKNAGIDRSAVDALASGESRFFTTQEVFGDGMKEKVRVIYARISTSIILQLGYSLETERKILQAFNQIFFTTMTALLVLAIAIGWFMARRALSGVESVTRIAQQISEKDLNQRVPVKHKHEEHDEIDRMAETFNQMLDRIQSLVNGTRQMNDNIAHDLRSPITRIRGLAEVTLTNARHKDDYEQMAASTVEECDRLLDMINTMLTISRTESGVTPLKREPVDLSALVSGACDLFQALAEDQGVKLNCEVADDITIAGDQAMLQRLVANLIDNAIKYTEPGGRIQVSLSGLDTDRACLRIADTGIGIAPQDQERVFQRFFRGDQSRTRGGSGLGLSLAQAIARAHGGDITLQSAPGSGSTFSIHLPVMSIQNTPN
jgi:heavy metal sensor kinase